MAKAAGSATPPSTPVTARHRGRRQASHQSRTTATCFQRQQPRVADVGCDQQLPAANASSRLLPTPAADVSPTPNDGLSGDNAKTPSPPTLAESTTPRPLPAAADRQQRRQASRPLKHKQPPAANAGGQHRHHIKQQTPTRPSARHKRPPRAPPPSQRQQPQAANAGGESHAHAQKQKSAIPSPRSDRPPPTPTPTASQSRWRAVRPGQTAADRWYATRCLPSQLTVGETPTPTSAAARRQQQSQAKPHRQNHQPLAANAGGTRPQTGEAGGT